MKIIRWLLSHIILVVLIVVVIYGYMFWGRLTDSDTPGGKVIAYLSNKVAPANEGDEQDIATGLNGAEVSRENLAGSAAKDVRDSVEDNMNASGKAVVVSNELPPAESSISRQQSKASVDDASSTIENSAVSAGTNKISKDTFDSSDVVEQLDSSDADNALVDVNNTSALTNRQTEAPVTDTQLTIGESGAASQLTSKEKSAEVKANWIIARESYHRRNYVLSEKSYQQVINNTEDNYDAYGELGNVYFNQGKNAQAASAYYEAAAIFVRIGQRSRAESLIDLLWRLDPSKADELQQLIDSASS